jgi:aldehyde:ferredoxin oxidoreductase
MRVGERI